MAKWIKTNFPGVRYREHPTRKNGVKRDQYFTIRYKLAGKDREEGLGWASENWTAVKAYERLKELKENRKSGEGPQTLAEKRIIEEGRKAAKKTEADRREKEAVTFGKFFNDTYLPQAKADKKERSVTREEGLFKVWISPALGLRGRGKRFFCPSCQPDGGKTPDLVIGDKGFNCHKCGLKGDLLNLIEVAGNMDFPSAVAWLEGETGIPSPGRQVVMGCRRPHANSIRTASGEAQGGRRRGQKRHKL